MCQAWDGYSFVKLPKVFQQRKDPFQNIYAKILSNPISMTPEGIILAFHPGPNGYFPVTKPLLREMSPLRLFLVWGPANLHRV
jgi:hypothetical protein